ncbi:alpha/beta hydrolase [Roseitranquillus sediminis]|uniref:alpha/beta hydrolase n=1 Tax=Roseitranquillus sediminis TaxID=2809051 RepID=UPI001D0C04BC|nr:hypothetical protein [Roseitranquillus sediminis]MBM9593963.1 hypothetical protein [Roseitranquillus sediminis]
MSKAFSFGVEATAARVGCVFVHGRGQTPEDIADLVLGRLSTPVAAYRLPRASGKSWYKARAIDPLTERTEVQLAAALDAVGTAVAELRAAAPGRPLLLAGFSQGACVALEWACSQGAWPGALAVLTGCRVGVRTERPVARLDRLPVYATCGDEDPWIPLDAFAAATVSLGHAGARVRAEVFPGRTHEVSEHEIGALDAILAALAAGRPPFDAP